MKQDMPNKAVSRNGYMQKVYAYDEASGALLGSGYIIHRDNGDTIAPSLFNFKGEPLPKGMYILQITDEGSMVVIPRMVQ